MTLFKTQVMTSYNLAVLTLFEALMSALYVDEGKNIIGIKA